MKFLSYLIESLPGNVFQLGNTAWRVLKVESSALRVADAAGQPPNIPFWFGEDQARYVLTCPARSVAALLVRAKSKGIDLLEVGMVTEGADLEIGTTAVSLGAVREAREGWFPALMESRK